MQKTVISLIFGALLSLTTAVSMALPQPLPQPLPLPQPPPASAYKVFPRVNFVEGADLQSFEQRHGHLGGKGIEAVKLAKTFDGYVREIRKTGKSRLGVTLEAVLKAQLDEFYRQYNPPQRNLRFIEFADLNEYDLVIYGVYTRRPYYGGGLQATITIANIRTGETESFGTMGDPDALAKALAGGLFHEYQKTRFPMDITMFGRNLHVIEKNVIYRPSTSPMWELYKQARLACEMQEARLTTERELTALGTLGDYRGGISIGQKSVPTYYWAVDYDRVYVAPWSQSSSATNLNPQEYLNYVCVQDSAAPSPRLVSALTLSDFARTISVTGDGQASELCSAGPLAASCIRAVQDGADKDALRKADWNCQAKKGQSQLYSGQCKASCYPMYIPPANGPTIVRCSSTCTMECRL